MLRPDVKRKILSKCYKELDRFCSEIIDIQKIDGINTEALFKNRVLELKKDFIKSMKLRGFSWNFIDLFAEFGDLSANLSKEIDLNFNSEDVKVRFWSFYENFLNNAMYIIVNTLHPMEVGDLLREIDNSDLSSIYFNKLLQCTYHDNELHIYFDNMISGEEMGKLMHIISKLHYIEHGKQLEIDKSNVVSSIKVNKPVEIS